MELPQGASEFDLTQLLGILIGLKDALFEMIASIFLHSVSCGYLLFRQKH